LNSPWLKANNLTQISELVQTQGANKCIGAAARHKGPAKIAAAKRIAASTISGRNPKNSHHQGGVQSCRVVVFAVGPGLMLSPKAVAKPPPFSAASVPLC